MLSVVVFKSVDGKRIMSFSDQRHPGADKRVTSALSLGIHQSIALNVGGIDRVYEIVSKEARLVTPKFFWQKPVSETVFTLQPASGEWKKAC